MDNTINDIKVEDIILSKLRPHQEDFDDELDNLVISIQNYGIIQPLLLRYHDDKYEIVLGNRRYKAAMKAGLKQVPAIVLKLNDKQAAEYIILDNIQRKELTEEEQEKIYKEFSTKYNVDKYYIENNLGLKQNGIELKFKSDSKPQSNLLQKEERFESPVKQNPQLNLKVPKKRINTIGRDIVNLEDLNQKELEREDFIMNNEPMNNNIVNTNVSNMPGVTQSTNAGPTFGGRFFPSLEDEQTNMGLNTTIASPSIAGNQNISPTNTTNPTPLIDLTDLTNDSKIQNSPISTSNPQLEPIPNFSNPTLDTLNQPSINDPIQTFTPPSQSAPFELPKQNTPSNFAQMSETTLAEPAMPNIEQFTNPQPSMIDMSQIASSTPPQPELPNLNQFEQPLPTPIEVPQMNNQVPSQVEIPTIDQISTPNPIDISQIGTPLRQEVNIPNVAQFDQPPMNTFQDTEPKVQESKDITPAINTIKSLADTISSLGYKINITENDTSISHNITIEIQK